MIPDDYKTLPRLYVACENITGEERCELSEGQHHYLRNVMRLAAGARLRCFNGRDGEWLAELLEINKKNAIIRFVNQVYEQKSSPDIWVLASPVKKEAFDIMIEKSSELGASRFMPVVCAHTVVHRVNAERLAATAIEAAEQCERLDVMSVHELENLKIALETWPCERKIIFCIERADAPPLLKKLQSLPAGVPLAILVGPEGGFSAEEAAYIQSLPFVESVTLGPRILRAETALLAALACVQAARDSG